MADDIPPILWCIESHKKSNLTGLIFRSAKEILLARKGLNKCEIWKFSQMKILRKFAKNQQIQNNIPNY
jgi:hypothetical protein